MLRVSHSADWHASALRERGLSDQQRGPSARTRLELDKMTKHRCRVARTFDLKNKTLDCSLSVGPFQRAHWARARALCAAHPARTCKKCWCVCTCAERAAAPAQEVAWLEAVYWPR